MDGGKHFGEFKRDGDEVNRAIAAKTYMAEPAGSPLVRGFSELKASFPTNVNLGQSHMLIKLQAWISSSLDGKISPLKRLAECFARRGVNHAGWRAKDRSRHRVHAVLYDDLLQ